MSRFDPPGWWSSLRHFGLLLSPSEVLRVEREHPIPALTEWQASQLRRQINRLDSTDLSPSEFASWFLKNIAGLAPHDTGHWTRGSNVSPELGHTLVTGETVKPRHYWKGLNGGRLAIFICDDRTVGVGRGRKFVSDVIQWLRLEKAPLALVTNGRQWRLLHAGLDWDAGCESDRELWFEDGAGGPQLHALRALLQASLLDQDGRAPCPLATAIAASRRGHAELSSLLGERVREAVECLVRSHGERLREAELEAEGPAVYRAAVRMMMRVVVVLFAESRDLLPRDNPIYNNSYGVQSLFDQLNRIAVRARSRLGYRHSAWPRMLSLFRLIHGGSHHPSLEIPAYGGDLFAPGCAASPDATKRALHIFETGCFDSTRSIMPDSDVHRILELLTRTSVRIRQGRGSITTVIPIDFQDLSSEYIGILYEGLLDYELRTAPDDDAILFLGIGNEPALPLSRLEAMSDKQIKELLDSLKDTNKSHEPTDEDDAESADDAIVEPEQEDAADQEQPDDIVRARALAWTRSVCERASLVKKPRGALTPEKKLVFEQKIDSTARQLVKRLVLPGEWYLVRWGGTRKGSGTFYTRPQLAVPTVQRTLRPLAYRLPDHYDGPVTLAPTSEWIARKPEEILAVKVCDPACGSGSFPVAALRFLTDAIFASVFAHNRLTEDLDRTMVHLLGQATDDSAEESLSAELIPERPGSEYFEERLKAVIRRHVVERCIYGVDLDPLAVELCRLALWIETMHRDLPFSFLDHKIKCGNGLIGAWFDTFQHYPIMAWKREGGDTGHSNGVHYQKKAWTKAINAHLKDVVTPDLVRTIEGPGLYDAEGAESATDLHEAALQELKAIHALPVHEAESRARRYQDLVSSEHWQTLKRAFDAWCAIWFWPANDLQNAPLPSTLSSPTEHTQTGIERLAQDKRFFHWELEFPDVFNAPDTGFSAVIGNPPWETLQPVSKEYFSNLDPLYRSYGKQEALRVQEDLFTDISVEANWLEYNAAFKTYSAWMKFAACPWGDPQTVAKPVERVSLARGKQNLVLHGRWRHARKQCPGFADPAHPCRHQGDGKAYTYKLFLEQGYALLRNGGRLGFVIPSGLYSDNGTGALRELFLDHCQWEWLFGFENRDKIFDIHRSFKFNPVIIQKGGRTEAIQTTFMRRRLEDWESAEQFVTPYTRERVTQFSPKSRAILEVQSARDLQILEKIYSNSVLLGDDGPDGWGIKYAQGDFNMTSDSKLFPPRPKWEEKGYKPDEYSRWLLGAWRPIDELWPELGIDPRQPVPIPTDCQAEIDRGIADGTVARTDSSTRCAQPPYDSLPIPRSAIPPGIILSRDATEWIRESEVKDTALPLYEGRMIGQFDFSQKGWVSGKGRTAEWRDISWESKRVEPQYLMKASILEAETLRRHLSEIEEAEGLACATKAQELLAADATALAKWRVRYLMMPKAPIMNIGSATNSRTVIGSLLVNAPCNHALNPIRVPSLQSAMALAGILNSYAYDAQVRIRLTGLNISFFILDETVIPRFSTVPLALLQLMSRAMCSSSSFCIQWLSTLRPTACVQLQLAFTTAERLRVTAMINASVMGLFRYDWSNARHLLRDCDAVTFTIADSKGFWRVDKDKDPEIRHTVLTLIAFHDLQSKIDACGGDREAGIEAFLNQNDGEGWMLPETLCLADYGLGHDDRAKVPQPVASRLGPRFYDWQLAQSAEESWEECHLHARNLLGEAGYAQLLKEIEGGDAESEERDTGSEAAGDVDLFGEPVEVDLFGNAIGKAGRRR